MRKFLAFIVFIVVGALAAPPDAAAAQPDVEAHFVAVLNDYRASQGLPSLHVHDALVAKAQGWSDHMVATGLAHSDLRVGLDGVGWARLGENVGQGGSVESIQAAWLASPSHQANIADPRFEYIGIGVTVGPDGQIWVTQEFLQPPDQIATTGKAPAPKAKASGKAKGKGKPAGKGGKKGGPKRPKR